MFETLVRDFFSGEVPSVDPIIGRAKRWAFWYVVSWLAFGAAIVSLLSITAGIK
jgi:hypothetical protein